MKKFKVILRTGNELIVEAETFGIDSFMSGPTFHFTNEGKTVGMFVASEVAGVVNTAFVK